MNKLMSMEPGNMVVTEPDHKGSLARILKMHIPHVIGEKKRKKKYISLNLTNISMLKIHELGLESETPPPKKADLHVSQG